MEIAVGIDIGGTNTKMALVNKSGALIARKRLDTRSSRTIEDYFQAIFDQIDVFKQEQNLSEIAGIGIGAPGCNEKEGTIERTANLIIKEKVPIRKIFSERFNAPAYLVKDSNAAAIGEHLFGGAKKMSDFAVLTLGTGLGCGIFVNGALVTGAEGLASEYGHVSVEEDGRQCGCGRRGCLETYVSATGIKRTVFHLLAREKHESELRSLSFDEMTSMHIAQAAGRGDQIARKAFKTTGAVLGRKIADLVAAIEPQAVFLSGGLAQSGDLLLRPTKKYFQKEVLHLMKGKVQIIGSKLGADDAALLGAASLALYNQKEKIS